MNRRAKIITFHCVPNYGAVMQAYALQTILRNYFEYVEIMNYCPFSLTSQYKVINNYSIKSIFYSLWSAKSYLEKKRKFKFFSNNYLCVNDKKYRRQYDVEEYDTDFYFLGSDQIWNPEILKGFDPIYFGHFPKKTGATVISYAASIGKRHLTNKECETIRELINGIDYISVREEAAKNILSHLTNKEISVVLDPTLLLDKDKWSSITKKIYCSDYLLYYSLNGYVETEVMAKKIANYLGLNLIEISGKKKPIVKKPHIAIYNAGPEEFLSYIRNASYVVTDSFHGTVFSIIFERPFITIPHKTRNSRIDTLLGKLGLLDRMISEFDKEIIKKHYNVNIVNQKLSFEKMNSYNFLEKAISNM